MNNKIKLSNNPGRELFLVFCCCVFVLGMILENQGGDILPLLCSLVILVLFVKFDFNAKKVYLIDNHLVVSDLFKKEVERGWHLFGI